MVRIKLLAYTLFLLFFAFVQEASFQEKGGGLLLTDDAPEEVGWSIQEQHGLVNDLAIGLVGLAVDVPTHVLQSLQMVTLDDIIKIDKKKPTTKEGIIQEKFEATASNGDLITAVFWYNKANREKNSEYLCYRTVQDMQGRSADLLLDDSYFEYFKEIQMKDAKYRYRKLLRQLGKISYKKHKKA